MNFTRDNAGQAKLLKSVIRKPVGYLNILQSL